MGTINADDLRRVFAGEILTPQSAGYDAARKIWNGMIDRRPAVIARCSSREDVVHAVRFAAELDIYPAIRAGGHNVAGWATVDDGLVIDVSQMKGIEVDVEKQLAHAQAGLNWGEFDEATHARGLATTGGLVSTTGIAGLTLGGGVGWLMGRCGLVCDNTVSYDVVTANSESIRASATENPDLYWALKGGAGNFGVVTSISYRLYPITTVISGLILFSIVEARDVLKRYRDFTTAGLPDELILYASIFRTPDGAPCLGVIPAYCGDDLSEGERLIKNVGGFGNVLADMTQRMPYVAMQKMLDPFCAYGIRSYWKSNFLADLADSAIDVFVDFAEKCPSAQTFCILEHAHGVATRVGATETAFPQRSDGFDLVILSMWEDAQRDAENISWTRDFYDAMRGWSAGSVYVNALSEDDGLRVREAFGGNYDRLRMVKQKYDPTNRFRRNQNIAAAASAAT